MVGRQHIISPEFKGLWTGKNEKHELKRHGVLMKEQESIALLEVLHI